MENNYNELLNDQNKEINIINIFKPDYTEQKMNNNTNFQKWKKSMINIYGENTKFFKCSEEQIIFCVSNYNCKNENYKNQCPSCYMNFCNYCLKKVSHYNDDHGKCCLKRRIKYIFLIAGPTLLKDKPDDYKGMSIFLLIPFLSFLYFVAGAMKSLFLQLMLKNSLEIEYYEEYSKFFRKYERVIIILYGFILSIPYNITVLLFTIVISLISITFKNCITRYILSVLREAFIG